MGWVKFGIVDFELEDLVFFFGVVIVGVGLD